MSILNKAAFTTTYADPSGTFADNTTRLITESDLRQLAQDIADSLFGVTQAGSITFVTVQIGDWDMQSNNTTTVSHGISDFKTIRSISVMVRDDADAVYTLNNGFLGTSNPLHIVSISSTDLVVGRTVGFASTDYNATSYNRGWITIGYEN